MVLYTFREREMILDLFDKFCGARLTTNIMEIGGFTRDIPDGWLDECREFVQDLPGAVCSEYADLLSANPIWLNRTKGIGIITAEDAIAYSLTGPMIRGSGVAFDIRKARPYLSTTASIGRCRSARTATPTTAISSAWRRCASRSR